MTNCTPKSYQICAGFADITKISVSLESPHFLIFSAKWRMGKILTYVEQSRTENVIGKKCTLWKLMDYDQTS